MNHYPFNSLPGALVEYRRPTNRNVSKWRATITRGKGAANRWRASVPYQDGPDAAVAALLQRFNECHDTQWIIQGTPLSLSGGEVYAYPVGPEA